MAKSGPLGSDGFAPQMQPTLTQTIMLTNAMIQVFVSRFGHFM